MNKQIKGYELLYENDEKTLTLTTMQIKKIKLRKMLKKNRRSTE